MNRFRGKKKEREESPISSDQSSMHSLRGFLRGKKAQEERPEPKMDIATALPSHDEFRTSLLMTGLSARFSMLREQDDPHSKIGKASDDSVLFPNRQSRLMDYGGFGTISSGHGAALKDIAEVESIRAPFTRMDSFASADDNSSTKGSIMSRGKPTDGNNLFGGRQKIVVGNRTLYDDDVAMSAFQKWRREERERERERKAFDHDEARDDSPGRSSRRSDEDSSAARSESPSLAGFSRRRETSSTTASSMARNSTAAVSIASQQSQATTASMASGGPSTERSVTRTRRLYEQALNQDMHVSQSTALSRIDTLSGKRTFTRGSPDLNSATSPQTSFGFGDRRTVLTKASAPNLRTTSPPISATGSADNNLPSNLDSRFNFPVGTPPLSPPISETGEIPMLAIQPNDVGKATAMGVFQKPAQPYDESKYAQRQLQLQQGREAPMQRNRADTTNLSIRTDKDNYPTSATLRGDSDAPSYPNDHQPKPSPATPTVILQRPADSEHPAFRQDPLPTPLSFSSQISDSSCEPSPRLAKPEEYESPVITQAQRMGDSPTLGPTSGLTTGLGGLVRQHMRSESSTSSIYGPMSAGLEPGFQASSRDSTVLGPLADLGVGNWQEQWKSYQENPLNRNTHQTKITVISDDTRTEDTVVTTPATLPADLPAERPAEEDEEEQEEAEVATQEDNDDFADRVAIARRRVKERLTSSYNESADSSRAPSPLPQDREPMPPAKSHSFGLLRGKSSRGSLAEKNRDVTPRRNKGLGLGVSTMSTSPSPSRETFDESSLPPMEEEPEPRGARAGAREKDWDCRSLRSAKSTKSVDNDDDQAPPGLRAFRQARRQLQKQKELAVIARHHTNGGLSGDVGGDADYEQGGHGRPRADSRAQQLPQRNPSNDSYRSGASRSPPRSERDRSGSETSNGSVPPRRPLRLRNNSSPYETQQSADSLDVGQPRRPMLRSPGLPGTDIKRSPIMPPQPHPNATGFGRSASSGNLTVQSSRAGDVSPMSPITPLSQGLPSSPKRPLGPPSPGNGPSAAGMTGGGGGRVMEAKKKLISKKDISDPTFLTSTSRVPTVNLPQGYGPDSRQANGSRTAPPLPPINPRRTRGPGNGFPGFQGGGLEGEAMGSRSTPHLPLKKSSGSLAAPESRHGGASPVSDDEKSAASNRWRFHQMNSDSHAANSKIPISYEPFGAPRDTRAFVAAAPPVGRSVVTPTLKKPSSMPGGMI